MRIVIQRVTRASVSVCDEVVGAINEGLMLLVGIQADDTLEDIEWLTQKITNLRIFDDEKGVMNCSIMDVNGDMLIISQFTLMARTKKGNRPSYIDAAVPDIAIPIYERFKEEMAKQLGKPIQAGLFGADMQVELVNDGPVTIIMDSKNRI
ncbi:MAG: D-aminoacyl-tRNA deacylase [Marinifilaceae bacterium]